MNLSASAKHRTKKLKTSGAWWWSRGKLIINYLRWQSSEWSKPILWSHNSLKMIRLKLLNFWASKFMNSTTTEGTNYSWSSNCSCTALICRGKISVLQLSLKNTQSGQGKPVLKSWCRDLKRCKMPCTKQNSRRTWDCWWIQPLRFRDWPRNVMQSIKF